MRHRKKRDKLRKQSSHRNLMVRSLMNDLIMNEKLQLTSAKARVVSSSYEQLVTKTMKAQDSRNKKRILHSLLNNKEVEKKFLKEVLPKYSKGASGMTRVIKIGNRQGDNALVCQVELV
ncbi:50S ribosomal protein L17 [Patescibacteria group bacterium]|nr:50S ribosomal protein L17 [Patescibacteria group bacterium]